MVTVGWLFFSINLSINVPHQYVQSMNCFLEKLFVVRVVAWKSLGSHFGVALKSHFSFLTGRPRKFDQLQGLAIYTHPFALLICRVPARLWPEFIKPARERERERERERATLNLKSKFESNKYLNCSRSNRPVQYGIPSSGERCISSNILEDRTGNKQN